MFSRKSDPSQSPVSLTMPLVTDFSYAQPRSVQRRSWFQWILREGVVFVAVLIILYSAANLAIPRFMVEGESMQPTFHDHERVVVSRIDYLVRNPNRGHVIVFRHIDDTYLIKRIIGLPGESIDLIDGTVFVNGIPLEESYIDNPCTTFLCQNQHWELEENEYFVLGDNRNASLDSHNFGPIQSRQIVGRVFLKY